MKQSGSRLANIESKKDGLDDLEACIALLRSSSLLSIAHLHYSLQQRLEKSYIFSPYLFSFSAEYIQYIIRGTGLEEVLTLKEETSVTCTF